MSPEQAEGRWDEVGPASDVYSLGATLYTLLTGRSPFAGPGDGVVPRETEGGAIPPLRTVLPGVPRLRALEAICRKAMAPKPEDRYASPRALAEDLEHWLADEPVAADREGWRQRLARWARRHQSWMVAGTAALLLVTVGSVVAMLFLRDAWLDASMARTQEEAQRKQPTGSATSSRRNATSPRCRLLAWPSTGPSTSSEKRSLTKGCSGWGMHSATSATPPRVPTTCDTSSGRTWGAGKPGSIPPGNVSIIRAVSGPRPSAPTARRS